MRKIRTAIIGCGRVAFHHRDMLDSVESVEVVAVCDLVEEKALKLADGFRCTAYSNYRKMLAEEKVDLVTLATPTGAHYSHAKDILKNHPSHVLLEKPMVLRVSHGIELHELAKSNGVQIFPVYQNRFNKSVQRVKRALLNSELGAIMLATVRVRWCRPQRYYDLAAWRGTYAMDGGAYVNQGIHFIDILRYLAGEVEEVNSCFGRLGAKPEAEDTGLSLLKFRNGAMGAIEITMAARPDDFEASVSIVGSKGLAELGGWCTNELVRFSPSPEDEDSHSEEVLMAYGLGHREVYKKVADAILNNTSAPVEFSDGMETIRLLHSLYRSNEDRQWIHLDDNLESARLGEESQELLAEYLMPNDE